MKTLKRNIAALTSALIISVLLFDVSYIFRADDFEYALSESHQLIFIIDAGHGGADGGAVSISGALESDINLDIALKIYDLLALFGHKAVLTRNSSEINYPEDADTIRKMKTADQKARLNLINSYANAVFLSIHQNKYSSPGPFGAQTLYGREEGSARFAETMQQLLVENLDRQNHRTAVPVSDDIYLMRNAKCPALLIECGFLSNPSDEAKLTADTYRTKIAAVIAGGCIIGSSLFSGGTYES